MTKRPTRPVLVIEHLKRRGHISEGTALLEYGRFRLGDAVYRLRTSHRHLVPEGFEIVTVHKQDTNGNPYGEYHYVQTRSAKVRNMVEAARAREEAATRVQGGHAPSVGASAQA